MTAPKNPTTPPRRPRTAKPRAPAASARPGPLMLDLALQGGGSHGAFTWGVLDRLLQEPDLAFDGVSGTSAGALNAAVLATGLARGGPAAARQALTAFWRDVAGASGCFGSLAAARAGEPLELDRSPGAPVGLIPPWFQPMAEWAWRFTAVMQQFASPYQLNPLGLNPLREVVERHVDVAAIAAGPLKVFVTATSVHSGQAEIFEGDRLSVDALLASACLPHLFQAVEIDGVPYWDGGYTGNPAIWPLIYGTRATDVLLVKINPLERRSTPQSPMAIANRVGEITFNAGLTGELRAIAFVQRLLKENRVEPRRYKDLRLHMVHDEEELAALGAKSKLDTRWDFLQALHGMGEQAASRWLEQHRADVGVRSSLDIEQTFLRRR